MSDLNLIAVVERARNKAADRTLDEDQRIGIAVVRRQQLEPADDARRITTWRDHLSLIGVEALPKLSTAQSSASPFS